MDPVTITASLIGFGVGWFGCHYRAALRRRQYLRETTSLMKQSDDIKDRHYAATAMAYRSALEQIEAGNIGSAKKELSNSIAIFYHAETKRLRELQSDGILPEVLDWSSRELKAIEHDARRFESLRIALARQHDESRTEQA